MHVKFSAPAASVTSKARLPLTRNGPYIDIHLGDMTREAPIGQTYYLRPRVSYCGKSKKLRIILDRDQPTVHMNTNSVSDEVGFSGTITVTDFEYGRYNPSSLVVADVRVKNRTGLPVRGFHVHDGELVRKGEYAGYTNFGGIVFFLATTPYWRKHASRPGFPLPLAVATPNSDFLVEGWRSYADAGGASGLPAGV